MRKFMTISLLFLTLCLSVSSARSYILRREVKKRINPAGCSTLGLNNRFGSVRIERSAGEDIDVAVDFKIRAPSKSKALEIFEGVVVDIYREQDSISLYTDLPKLRDTGVFSFTREVRTSVKIDYLVLLPSGIGIKIDNLNGDVSMTGINSEFDISNGTGDVRIINSSPVRGRVELTRGEIIYKFPAPSWNGELSLNCGVGDITFLTSVDVSALVDAESERGRVRLDLAEDHEVVTKNRRRARIVFGKGAGKISLRNVSGVIKIVSGR